MNNKGKKLLALMLVLLMGLTVFTACSGGGEGEGEGEGEGDVADIPTYTAVTEATFPPFDTVDEEGNVVGFDMDIMNAIGEDQGFKVEYTDMAFDSLIPAVQSGTADMVTAGMNAMDPERREKVDFSDTYYDSGLVVVVAVDNDDITGMDSLTPDMKVASQIGTTGADQTLELKDNGQIAEAVILDGYDTCMLQVINGDVAAVIVDKPVAEAYIKKQEGKVKIVGETLNAESYGFAVQKGNTELLDKINAGLANIKANGTYDELYTKWFE